MNAKAIFTKEATQAAIEADKVQSAKTVKLPALTTPLGSRIMNKGKITQTAELDMVLLTAMALSDSSAHVSQVVAFADSVGIDCSATGMTKKARILKHIKDNKIAVVENNVIQVREQEIAFWQGSFQSAYFKQLVFTFAPGIAEALEITAKDYDLLSEEEKKQFVENAYYEECIDQALVLHKEFCKPAGKKKKAGRRS